MALEVPEFFNWLPLYSIWYSIPDSLNHDCMFSPVLRLKYRWRTVIDNMINNTLRVCWKDKYTFENLWNHFKQWNRHVIGEHSSSLIKTKSRSTIIFLISSRFRTWWKFVLQASQSTLEPLNWIVISSRFRHRSPLYVEWSQLHVDLTSLNGLGQF